MTDIQPPNGMHVIERGWLSSNSVLFRGARASVLVDSGYGSHARQTTALVATALRGRALDQVVNTHLHSDHCGGNAALQQLYPAVRTLIPPGMSSAVADWDPVALGYVPTGQDCPRFGFDAHVLPGTEIELADTMWQVHAAPGHDPDSIILFEPQSRMLISADALWENGFGVVFEELEGIAAFGQVGASLDLIERLDPQWVIPGHGRMFPYAAEVLGRARARLDAFIENPERHGRHAAKVMLKFKLLDSRQMPLAELVAWAAATRHFQTIHQRFAASTPVRDWIGQLMQELVRSSVLRRVGDTIHDG